MRTPILLLILLIGTALSAQSFPIGTRDMAFFDASRNRNVTCVIHYPALAAGTDAVTADGAFPVLVFGHGFVMVVASYGNFRDHFVPQGYILVLPTTEGGLGPEHGTFGQDLAFLATAMQDANMDPASPFFQHVLPSTALMGHSMGGGASVLGAAGITGIQTLVNFAAAETGPSAIAAAQNVMVPSLVFAGSDDCVTPPDQHQMPIYQNLGSNCKAYVSVLGGGHCYFANADLLCSFGESSCSTSLPITREQQQSVVNDLAGLWLDHFLKGVPGASTAFMDSLATSTRIGSLVSCLSTGIDAKREGGISIGPVPAADRLHINGLNGVTEMRLYDAQGRLLFSQAVSTADVSVDVSAFPAGIYRMRLDSSGGAIIRSFVVAR